MIFVQNHLRTIQVLGNSGPFFPWNGQHPIQIISHHGRFRRHRTHIAEFLQFRRGLFARLFGKLGFLDVVFNFLQLVTPVLGFTQLFLDRFHLFVQIIFALGLLHLALDPATDFPLHLHHADFGFHQGVNPLQPFVYRSDFQQFLLFGNLQRQMRGHGVGKLRWFINLIDRDQNFGRNFSV